MAKEKKVVKAAPKKKMSKQEMAKFNQYNGLQLSRKMDKLWNLDGVLSAGPKPQRKEK